MNRFIALLFCVLVVCAALPAAAQDSDNSGDVPASARLEVRIGQLEEQLRRMEGAIEQLSYQNKQLKEQLDKSNGDTQYRLQALEQKSGGAAAAPVSQGQGSDQMQQVPPAGEANGDNGDTIAAAPPAPSGAQGSPQFASARDHYNYAFRLMNQAKYAEAGNSFAAFTHRYPHDALIGNAFYWLGETYYVRRDYLHAADDFRQGYEAMPAGPKAADNLLKLAMSLDAMKKDTEACVVLKQVVAKFDASGSSIRSRAEQEMNRIGCN